MWSRLSLVLSAAGLVWWRKTQNSAHSVGTMISKSLVKWCVHGALHQEMLKQYRMFSYQKSIPLYSSLCIQLYQMQKKWNLPQAARTYELRHEQISESSCWIKDRMTRALWSAKTVVLLCQATIFLFWMTLTGHTSQSMLEADAVTVIPLMWILAMTS